MNKTIKTVGYFALLTIIYVVVKYGVYDLLRSSLRPAPVVAGCPLCQSAFEGDLAEVRRMLASGADPNASDKINSTALMTAATKGHAEIVKTLIAAGANPNASDKTGYTALMGAATKGHAEVVKILIAAGANPDATFGIHKDITPLMAAAAADDNLEVVNALIAGKANLHLTDIRGATALMHAAVSSHPKVVKALHAAGADLNTVAKDGSTALMITALFGRIEIIKTLLAAGANPNTVGGHGATALMYVALAGNPEFLKEAIAAQLPSEKLTSVHGKKIQEKMATLMQEMQEGRKNHPEVIKLLLAAGADLNATTEDGITALDVARNQGYVEVVRVLEAAGAR